MFPGAGACIFGTNARKRGRRRGKKCCQEINFGSIPYTNLTPNRNRTYIPCLEGRCSIH